MLAPDDRIALIEALRPPAGYVLDHALATTFTLDLEAALSVPLAFASHRLRDPEDQISVLEALRECADKVDVFCEAGAIGAPTSRSPLFAFLEPMIHPVHHPRHLFHPKLWLVRYRHPGGDTVMMRLLVLTRNLTADRSWDLALCLDGVIGDGPPEGAIPDVVEWALDHLVGPQLEPERLGRLGGLLDAARQTQWEPPEGVWDLRLHTVGVGGNGAAFPLAGTRALVISPFVTAEGLQAVQAGQRVLISRPEELDRLPDEGTAGIDLRVLDSSASLDDSGSALLSGLHAKAYVVEYGHRAWVTVGSPNATGPGLQSNIEFAVTLEGRKRQLGIDQFLGDAGLGKMLVPYKRQPVTEHDETLEQLQATLRRVAAVPFTATISPQDDGWREVVTAAEELHIADGDHLTLGLLTALGRAQPVFSGQPVTVAFGRLSVPDLTPFLILTVTRESTSVSTCLRAQLVNDPPDRLDQVLAAQVNTTEKFLRWLFLLLGEGRTADTVAANVASGESGADAWWRIAQERGLFEALVSGLADHPAELDVLGRFVDRVRAGDQGEAILPAGFDDVWRVVSQARDRLKASAA